MEQLVGINRQHYEAYRDGLRGLPGVTLIAYDPAERNNYQYIVVEVDPDRAPLNRDELVAVLHAENVLARKYFWPGCHRMEPYRSLQPNAGLLLPETERVSARIIVLPTGQTITEHIVGIIGGIVRSAFRNAHEVRKALTRTPRP